MIRAPLTTALMLCLSTSLTAADPAGYQRPPKAITDILDVPPTPTVSLSPTRDYLLLVERLNSPPISDLAAPMLRLAGQRINPQTNGPHLPPRNTGLILQKISDNTERRIELPADLGRAGDMAAPDDVLDAAGVAWSAHRHAKHESRFFEPAIRDGNGRVVTIWY